MKNLIILFIFCCGIVFHLHAQNKESLKQEKLSEVLRDITFYWKKDSLANNGFRLQSYQRLLNATIDINTGSFNIDSLKFFLGKPSVTWETNKGPVFVYYIRDGRLVEPPDNELGFISFNFSVPSKKLTIDLGHSDL